MGWDQLPTGNSLTGPYLLHGTAQVDFSRIVLPVHERLVHAIIPLKDPVTGWQRVDTRLQNTVQATAIGLEKPDGSVDELPGRRVQTTTD